MDIGSRRVLVTMFLAGALAAGALQLAMVDAPAPHGPIEREVNPIAQSGSAEALQAGLARADGHAACREPVAQSVAPTSLELADVQCMFEYARHVWGWDVEFDPDLVRVPLDAKALEEWRAIYSDYHGAERSATQALDLAIMTVRSHHLDGTRLPNELQGHFRVNRAGTEEALSPLIADLSYGYGEHYETSDGWTHYWIDCLSVPGLREQVDELHVTSQRVAWRCASLLSEVYER